VAEVGFGHAHPPFGQKRTRNICVYVLLLKNYNFNVCLPLCSARLVLFLSFFFVLRGGNSCGYYLYISPDLLQLIGRPQPHIHSSTIPTSTAPIHLCTSPWLLLVWLFWPGFMADFVYLCKCFTAVSPKCVFPAGYKNIFCLPGLLLLNY